MKSHRNYHSLIGGSNGSSGFGASVDGLLRSQSDDEMLDITTGTTDDLRNVPNRSHGTSNLLGNGGGNLVDSEKIDAAEEEYGQYLGILGQLNVQCIDSGSHTTCVRG